jgi:AcrR family transcriptional regulator
MSADALPARAGDRAPLGEASIVDAALEIVREGGVQELNMRSLTDRLGVSLGATYRHVRGKEELLEACARRIFAEVAEVPPDDLPVDGLQALRDTILRLIDTVGAYPGLAPWIIQNIRLDSTGLTPLFTETLAGAGRNPDQISRIMHVLFFYIQGALLADYRQVLSSVGVADYADQLRLDIEYIVNPGQFGTSGDAPVQPED